MKFELPWEFHCVKIILGTNSYFKARQDQGNRRKRDLKTDERFRDAMTLTFKSFTNTPS